MTWVVDTQGAWLETPSRLVVGLSQAWQVFPRFGTG
jgi:hypothetical protein